METLIRGRGTKTRKLSWSRSVTMVRGASLLIVLVLALLAPASAQTTGSPGAGTETSPGTDSANESAAPAAPGIELTLDRAIDVALSDSYRIQFLQENLRWAKYNLWAARAGYRTYAQSSFYVPVYDEGTKLIDVSGVSWTWSNRCRGSPWAVGS
jgi:hypothetical protein